MLRKWLLNLTFGARLGAGFALLVLFLFVGGIFVLRQTVYITNLAAVTEQLHQHPFLVSNAALEIRAGLHTTRRAMEDVVLSGDPARIDAALAQIEVEENAAFENFALIGDRYLGNKQDIEAARRSFLEWRPVRDRIFESVRSGDHAAALEGFRQFEADNFATLRQQIDGIIRYARNRAGAFLAESATVSRSATWKLAGFVLAVVLAAAITVGFVVTRSVTRPIASLRRAMEKIARGDYATEVPHFDRHDEIGDMAATVEIFRKNGIEKLRAEKVKMDFLANMSHELRTPLNAILGFSEIISEEMFGSIGSPRYRQYVEDIHLSADHLLHIINDVLDLSRVEKGKLQLDPAPVDPDCLLHEVVRMIEPDATSRDVSISLTVEPNLPFLYGDAHRLRQIFLNLLVNAIKFTAPGGAVAIKVAAEADGCLAVAITDTGVGMSEGDIRVAVTPFGQVHTGPQIKGFGGVGLGLPLAIALTEMHGGKLEIDSKPSCGTTVTVSIPLQGCVERTAEMAYGASSSD